MEFYLSFADLFEKLPNKIGAIFIPVFLVTILVEALFIQARHGSYPWKNTGISALVAVGHLVTQAAAHGVIFGFIVAAVYEVRLTTIPVSWGNWPSLIALFLLTDLAFYVEHRCSHRIRLLWASHSVHHSTERMVVSAAFRLSWTPILSGVFLFYLPIVWIGFDPVWGVRHGLSRPDLPVLRSHRAGQADRVAGMGYQHAIGPSGPPRPQFRVHRQEFWRRSDDLGSPVRHVSGGASGYQDTLRTFVSALLAL
jgi:hypothetical protein